MQVIRSRDLLVFQISYYTAGIIAGSQQGSIPIVNMSNGQIDREYSVHTSTVM